MRDLDRRLARVGIAIEREQPMASERLDHRVHRLRVGERLELRTSDATPGVLRALAERHEPQEQLPARVAPASSFIGSNSRSARRASAPETRPMRR